MIVYLHGFASSGGASRKVRYLRSELPDVAIFAPTYSHDPALAIPFLEAYFLDRSRQNKQNGEVLLVVGAGLGGFYALHFQRLFAHKTVLINPVLWPGESLKARLGDNINFKTGEQFILEARHLHRFQALHVHVADTRPDLVLLDDGDAEVEAGVTRRVFSDDVDIQVFPGGSHRFDHLQESLPMIKALLDDA